MNSNHNIITMSASEIAQKIKAKELGISEVAKAFINRIEEVNPRINAIHQFEPKRILKEAAAKEKELLRGNPLGKLYGVPISLKDGFYAPGFRGAKGNCFLYQKSPLNKSATAVTRLLNEGAIILGITNVPEFLAAIETDNILHGRTNNPYNLERVAGGSSGGEAALIAAGGSCLGLGSDAGSSIRTPAHCCGIAGLKPTKGLVPLTGNVPKDTGGLHTQLATFGPLAKKVEDLALMLSVIAGPDDLDPDCAPVPLQSFQTVDVSRLRILYFLDNGIVSPCADTIKSINNAIKKLRPYVASINEVKLPDIAKETYKLVWETCFLGGNRGKLLAEKFAKMGQTEFSPLYQQYLKQAANSSFDNAELHKRIAEIYQYKREMLQLMHNADILLSPVNATPAREHGTTHAHMRDASYAATFNLTGGPAASINCGFSSLGLPIGLQIAAKPWQDHLVLAFAKKAQEVLGITEIADP